MKRLLLLIPLALLAIAWSTAYEDDVENVPGIWWGETYSEMPVYDWCYDAEHSIATAHDETVRDAQSVLSDGYIWFPNYPTDDDCPAPSSQYNNGFANACLSGHFNGQNEITIVDTQACAPCELAMFPVEVEFEIDEQSVCIDFDDETGEIAEADIFIDLAYMVEHPHGYDESFPLDLYSHVKATATRAFLWAVGLATSTEVCNSHAAACDSVHNFPNPDDEDGLEFIYHDTDGDGCVGLEEAGAYEALGGGIAFDLNHRAEGFPDPGWSAGRHRDFADMNFDKTINSGDMGFTASKFNQNVVGNGGPAPNKFDQQGDGIVNSGDLGIVASQFGDTCWDGP